MTRDRPGATVRELFGGRFGKIAREHLAESKGSLLWALLCTLGLSLTELVRPWPLKIIFDNVLLGRPLHRNLRFLAPWLAHGKVTAIVVISSSLLVIALLRGAFAYSQIHVTSRLGNEVVSRLRLELFAHLQRLSLSFHNRARSGEILTKIASDTNALKDVFAESFVTVLSQMVTLVAMFAMMFALSWRLSLVVLATIPILFTNLFLLYRKAKVSARTQRRKEERIASRIGEVMSTVSLVQAFGRESYETERFGAESAQYLEESIRNDRIEAMSARAVEIISAAGTWVVVLFGSLQVLKGDLTIGSVLVFTSYLNGMYRPIRNLAKLSTSYSKAMVSAQRISEVLDREPEIADAPDAIPARDLKGEIVFDHVSFGYEDEEGALKDVSFRIPAGSTVALVGKSGAGKSTIVSLILRLYEARRGSVSIDGVDVRRYARESLRGRIGLVLQGSILFGTSVRENIAYGKLDATDEEIVAAARAAHADEFIDELSDGYDTILGERGATLSGGQRQRLAIARALVRNAPILILDEPMSGLDVESEAKVKDGLRTLTAGRTCLLVTHDLAAAAEADAIVWLEEGRVAATGTHAELVERSRRYRGLSGLKAGPAEAPG